jgi:hypothetical protein
MAHLLIKNAKRSSYNETPDMPTSAKYNFLKGIWEIDNTPLMEIPNFAMGQATKKCDQETGEDQKGE